MCLACVNSHGHHTNNDTLSNKIMEKIKRMKTRQHNIKNKSCANDCVFTNVRLFCVSSPTAAPAVFASASLPAVRANTAAPACLLACLLFITRPWSQGQQHICSAQKTILLDIMLCKVKTTLLHVARETPESHRGLQSREICPKGGPQSAKRSSSGCCPSPPIPVR